MLSICVVVVEGDWVLDCFLMVFWGSCCNSRLGLLFRCWDGPGSLFLLPPPRIPAIGSRIFWALPCGELPLPKAALVGTRKIDKPPCFPGYLLTTSLYLSLGHPALLLHHKFSTKDPGWVVTERFLFARLFLVLISISVSPLAIAVHQLKLLFLMYDSCIPLVLRQRPFS